MIRLFVLLFLLYATKLAAGEGNFLNVAILELPDRYLADLPQKDRSLFLRSLSEDPDDPRLDYGHGWLHFYSDSDHDGVRMTSMLYLKLLRRNDDQILAGGTTAGNRTIQNEPHPGGMQEAQSIVTAGEWSKT